MVELFKDCKQEDCEYYDNVKKVCILTPGAQCPHKTTEPGNKKVKDHWNQKGGKGFKWGKK